MRRQLEILARRETSFANGVPQRAPEQGSREDVVNAGKMREDVALALRIEKKSAVRVILVVCEHERGAPRARIEGNVRAPRLEVDADAGGLTVRKGQQGLRGDRPDRVCAEHVMLRKRKMREAIPAARPGNVHLRH